MLFAAADRGHHAPKGRGELPDLVLRMHVDVGDPPIFQLFCRFHELPQGPYYREARDDQQHERQADRDAGGDAERALTDRGDGCVLRGERECDRGHPDGPPAGLMHGGENGHPGCSPHEPQGWWSLARRFRGAAAELPELSLELPLLAHGPDGGVLDLAVVAEAGQLLFDRVLVGERYGRRARIGEQAGHRGSCCFLRSEQVLALIAAERDIDACRNHENEPRRGRSELGAH